MANEITILAVLLSVAGGSFYLINALLARARIGRRMNLAVGGLQGSRRAGGMREGTANLRVKLGGGVAALGRLMPLGEEDREKIGTSLRRAGYRSTNAVAFMLGLKFACLLIGLVVGLIAISPTLPGVLGLGAGLIGGVFAGVLLNILPEFAIGRLAARRMRRITVGLAESFDLLVVCLESGLTFERALKRTVDNLKSFQPDLANEFGQTVLDISVHGRTREDALGRLADRLDSHEFRDLATTVAQSERHGTPMADALRKLASSVRIEAISRMQEKMARLPTLLIVPSITCVLPGILMIVGGPAFVQFRQSLGNFGG